MLKVFAHPKCILEAGKGQQGQLRTAPLLRLLIPRNTSVGNSPGITAVESYGTAQQ